MSKYFVCILFVLILISGCNPTLPETPSATPDVEVPTKPEPTSTQPDDLPPVISEVPVMSLPILFDDDGSPDGTTALFYMLSHPRADIRGISISYGEAYPVIYIQHIGRQLDDFGISNIPLGYGEAAPLAGNNIFPEVLREGASNYWGFPIPYPERTYPTVPAANLFNAVIEQSPEPVNVFISGPATNLAQALRDYPSIKQNIAAVYIMGGAINVPGNINNLRADIDNQVAEWNIYADPTAASEVLESGLPVYFVPLDATDQVLFSQQEVNRWREGSEPAQLSAEIYATLMNRWGTSQTIIWDLVTAAIMLEPSLCSFEPIALEIITAEGRNSGQTRIVENAQPNSFACLDPDKEKLLDTIAQVYTQGEIRNTPPLIVVEPPSMTATPTPESLVFRDDFSTDSLEGWAWENENPSSWKVTQSGWLEITSSDMSLLNDGTQTNLLCLDSVTPASDFQITVHLFANPIADFQQATLFLYQDGENFIAINRGFCDPCLAGGKGIYMDYKFPGNSGAYKTITEDNDVYLRLFRMGHVITGFYAFTAEEWQQFGKIGYYLEQPKICIGASNVDSGGKHPQDLIAMFDYFELSLP